MKACLPMSCLRNIESSPMLYFEGYKFIQNRCKRYGTNVFQTRLFGQKVICMSGEEAAKIFYDDKLFYRKGATPKFIQKTLFGQYGVQGLDGIPHKLRKVMFMSIMSRENLEKLDEITKKVWNSRIRRWEKKDRVILFDETSEIMCRIACKWAGVPLSKKEIKQRSKDLSKMVDAFGSVGIRHIQGRCARLRTESWIREVIEQIRTYRLIPYKGSAADIIPWHSNINGELLSTQVAAVELINILRPIVAIGTYITFGALAMYQNPGSKNIIKSNNDEYANMFVQEVRRFYPFTPFVGARVKKKFIWRNFDFPKGTSVLLDVYGINHDSTIWDNPNKFYPERFLNWRENLYSFVPQGGGDPNNGHRCAGEMVTIKVMKESNKILACNLSYKVPKQNLRYSLRRMPTLPKSGFIINKVRVLDNENTSKGYYV